MLAGGIAARECRGDNARSEYAWFIVQVVDIDAKTQLVVLDTTQYDHVPAGHSGAFSPGGVVGGILGVQLKEAETMVATNKAIIVAGHFPIESLRGKSRDRLERFLRDHHAATYLSGHIHSPTAARIHARGTDTFTEINVASVMGWPMEYAYVSARPHADDNKWRLSVEVFSAARELYDGCLAGWGPTKERTDSKSYYTAYTAERDGNVINVYDVVRDAMFEKLFSKIGAAPPDASPQIASRRLRASAFVHSQPFKDLELTTGARPKMFPDVPLDERDALDEIDSYERCQAIWASEAESAVSPAPSFWRTLPPVAALKARYDDPPPAHSLLLRSPYATHASWHWDVGVGLR